MRKGNSKLKNVKDEIEEEGVDLDGIIMVDAYV